MTDHYADVLLRDIRKAADLPELAESFKALDKHLSGGGRLPRDWSVRKK